MTKICLYIYPIFGPPRQRKVKSHLALTGSWTLLSWRASSRRILSLLSLTLPTTLWARSGFELCFHHKKRDRDFVICSHPLKPHFSFTYHGKDRWIGNKIMFISRQTFLFHMSQIHLAKSIVYWINVKYNRQQVIFASISFCVLPISFICDSLLSQKKTSFNRLSIDI